MKIRLLAFTVTVIALAGAANASGDYTCGDVPKDKWLSEAAIKEKAAGLGYDVRRVKVDGGCYEVYALDAKGQKVEAYFHPETADVVGVENDD